MISPDPFIDTASQLPPTGLDEGVRGLILKVVFEEIPGGSMRRPTDAIVISLFFRDRFNNFNEYLAKVATVWGEPTAKSLQSQVDFARRTAGAMSEAQLQSEERLALLRHMPEPDFRLVIEIALQRAVSADSASRRIMSICQSRGTPWQFTKKDGFVWVGDQVIEETCITPALTVLADPRLAQGAGKEFESARDELKRGEPAAFRHAATHAAAAVESALKVLLSSQNIEHDEKAGALKLFCALKKKGVLAADTQELVLACTHLRNNRSAHGGGAVIHTAERDEAEACVAAAANAIVFLGRHLP